VPGRGGKKIPEGHVPHFLHFFRAYATVLAQRTIKQTKEFILQRSPTQSWKHAFLFYIFFVVPGDSHSLVFTSLSRKNSCI